MVKFIEFRNGRDGRKPEKKQEDNPAWMFQAPYPLLAGLALLPIFQLIAVL